MNEKLESLRMEWLARMAMNRAGTRSGGILIVLLLLFLLAGLCGLGVRLLTDWPDAHREQDVIQTAIAGTMDSWKDFIAWTDYQRVRDYDYVTAQNYAFNQLSIGMMGPVERKDMALLASVVAHLGSKAAAETGNNGENADATFRVYVFFNKSKGTAPADADYSAVAKGGMLE